MKKQYFWPGVCAFWAVMFLSWEISPATAFEPGKTYDGTNYQEIEEMLVPSLLNWVKKGEFILPTAELNFEWRQGDAYRNAGKENEGKFDIDDKGMLVWKKDGSLVKNYYGNPFPTIDPGEPHVAAKIMENNAAVQYRMAASYGYARVEWIGKSGLERDLQMGVKYLYYQNNQKPPANQNMYLKQLMTFVIKPFALRGLIQSTNFYISDRTDVSFAYMPMLRRIRRVSAASRSDPFAGSDFCTDDSSGWAGKNASFNWKLLGEGTYLMPFNSPNITEYMKELPDGSLSRVLVETKIGHAEANWQGAAWAPVSFVWTPRQVWIIQGEPKDPYYNYGLQNFYLDKEANNIFFKEIYDKSGQYWKTVTTSWNCQMTKSGRDRNGALPSCYIAIDDKTHHASLGEVNQPAGWLLSATNMPMEVLGPQDYTWAAILQMSK